VIFSLDEKREKILQEISPAQKRKEGGVMLKGCIQVAIVALVVGYFLYSSHRDRVAWDERMKELKKK
jgi:hypothetical protein